MSAVGSARAASAPGVRRVFISYKRSVEPDTSLASFLYEALRKRGHHVFKDVDNIKGGEVFEDLIVGAITDSDFFIVLLTKEAMTSEWVLAETEMAVDSQTDTGHPKILPVRADTARLRLRFRAAIGGLNHLEWRDVKDNDGLLAAIVKVVELPGPLPAVPSLYRIEGSLWQSNRARQGLGGTMIVGVAAGEETSLYATRATGLGLFRVRILQDGALEAAIWSGASYRRVQSRPGEFIQMMPGDTHVWCFAEHSVDESVPLGPPSGSDKPIAVSFDSAIVKAAWTIVHQRSTAEEKFLIVMKNPEA